MSAYASLYPTLSSAFLNRVEAVARKVPMDPLHLLAIIDFETGGTFSPSIRNAAGSGATGLIQFMPKTARDLGTSTDALARMSDVEQLDWVERYFAQFDRPLPTLEDAYMAVLLPTAIGKGPDHVLFAIPSIAYTQNRGLDADGDGRVTVGEATAKVRARLKGHVAPLPSPPFPSGNTSSQGPPSPSYEPPPSQHTPAQQSGAPSSPLPMALLVAAGAALAGVVLLRGLD